MKKLIRIKGNIILTVVLLMAVFAILIPAIVLYVRNEANWTIKERRQTTAFHLSEAGLDRGYWKLIENSSNWTTITGGGTITGYNDDVIYTDVSGGSYKIKITKIDATSLSIICNAKDSESKEFRALKAIFVKGAVIAPIDAPAYGAGGGCTVWWGPIYSLGDIDLGSGSANKYWPRKMARGKIDGSGALGARDTNPNVPNIDPGADKEWWSYNSYPVPDISTPDLVYYKNLAQTTGYYYGTYQSPNNLQDSTPRCRWYDAGVRFGGNIHFRGYLFVVGNCDFQGGGDSTLGKYTATPPTQAWKEYAKMCPTPAAVADSGTANQYPGDAGYQNSTGSYQFGDGPPSGPSGEWPKNVYISFKGFIYCTGTFTAGGGNGIHGAIIVASGGAFGGGGFHLFYDDTLNVRFSSSTGGTKQSWQEVTPTPF